jgi:DNA-binding transcriptional ArsR family regulator
MDGMTLDDPRALRALASPLRLALIDWLRDHGPATASRCAEAVGASVQLCSYHLRALARWGFVAEVESDDGRERPWELVARSIDVPKGRLERPELLSAWSLLRARLIDHHIELVSEFVEREASYPGEWREAATFLTNPVYVTAAELERVATQISELVEPLMRRDRSELPAGAQPAYVVVWAIPRPDSE